MPMQTLVGHERNSGPRRCPIRQRSALEPRRAPLERRRLNDEAPHELRVTAGQQHADRTTHRVADGDHRTDAERFDQRCGVVGHVFELEAHVGSHAAAVAAMVDGHEREAGGQRLVGGEELKVGAGGPAVQEQHRGSVGIGVAMEAVEELTTTGTINV